MSEKDLAGKDQTGEDPLGRYSPLWVADVVREQDDSSAIVNETQEKVIGRIAERLTIDERYYYSMIDGKAGEVQKEFDNVAIQAIQRVGERDSEIGKVVRFTNNDVASFIHDRKNLEEVLNDLQGEIPDEERKAFETIKEMFLKKANETAMSVVEAAEKSEPVQIALFNEALRRVKTTLTDRTLTIGNEFDAAFIDTLYYKSLIEFLGPEPTRKFWHQIRIDEKGVNSIALRSIVARDKLSRFSRGKASYIGIPGNKEKVFPGGYEQGTVFTELSQQVVDVLTKKLEDSFELEVIEVERADEADLPLTATADSLILGTMASSDRLISTSGEIEEITDQMRQRIDADINQNNYNVDDVRTHQDAVAIGYIFGLLDRGDADETKTIMSMKVALRTIRDKNLRSKIKSMLKDSASQMNVEKKLAISLLFDDSDFFENTTIDQSLFNQKHTELQELETRIQKEKVRESIYDDGIFLGKRYPELRLGSYYVEKNGITDYNYRLEAAIAPREASFQIISEMLRIDAQVNRDKALSWDDAKHVMSMDLIKKNIALHNEEEVIDLLDHSSLDTNQQRMIAMLRVAVLSTTSGDVYNKASEISNLCERGFLSPQDILTAHNAVVVAVDGVNRALIQKNPNSKLLLDIHSLIETLAELKSESQDSSQTGSHRVGPFAEVRLYRRLKITHEDQSNKPNYFIKDSGANENPIYTYSLYREESEESTHTREVIQEEVYQELEAIERYAEIMEVEKYGDRTFEEATHTAYNDSSIIRDWLGKHFDGDRVEAANLYGWKKLAEEVEKETRKVFVAITDNSGEFAIAQEDFSYIYTKAGSIIRTLNEMDRESQSHFSRLDFNARRKDRQLAKAKRNEIITELEGLGVQKKRLRQLRRDNISDQAVRKRLRQIAIDTANASAARLLDQIEEINSRLNKIPDITEEVITRRISEDGMVEVPTVLTSESSGPFLDIREVSANFLGIGVGLEELLRETDLTQMIGTPIKYVAGQTLENIVRYSGDSAIVDPRSLPNPRWPVIYQTQEHSEETDPYVQVSTALTQLVNRLKNPNVDLSTSRRTVAQALLKAWTTRAKRIRQNKNSTMLRIALRVPRSVFNEMMLDQNILSHIQKQQIIV